MTDDVAKKRVSSLAKQYGVDSELILRLCLEKRIAARTPSSMLDAVQFAQIKSAIVLEKEKIERKEMAKQGLKIPMKVVLKKAPEVPDPPPPPPKAVAPKPVPPVQPVVQPVVHETVHAEAAPEVKIEHVSTPESAPKVEVAQPKPVVQEVEKEPVHIEAVRPAPVEEVKHEAPVEAIVVKSSIELPPVAKEIKHTPHVHHQLKAELPALKAADGALKVTVEKPDEQLAARIQKYMAEQAAKRNARRPGGGGGYSGPQAGSRSSNTGYTPAGGGGGGQAAGARGPSGYSGRFGKVPDGAPSGGGGGGGPRRPGGTGPTSGPNRRPGGGGTIGDRPRDVFAARAQEVGATGPVAVNKDDEKRNQDYQKKKASRLKSRKKKTPEQIEEELKITKNNVNRVMATVSRTGGKIKHRKEKQEDVVDTNKKIIEVPEFITISELAGLMSIMPNMVIAKCMELGLMVTINQRLDQETIGIIADEFGFETKALADFEEGDEHVEEEELAIDLLPRAPIVTVMGHVDHGKTSILDYVRKTNVVSGEAGGITQHIGAYKVNTSHGPICFLDTPGHQAFAAMRARGAQVTDIVILVVAADSMVMPQTKESIQHSRNAGVKIVVAINKVDLPDANPDKIRTQLAEEGVQVSEWGGNVSCVEVSAKTGLNMDKLLETVAIEAEMMELKANPNRLAKGVVIETRLDKGKGVVATILVEEGTLKVGDALVCGQYSGRVRSLLDEAGKSMKEAGPSTPAQVLGLEGMPQAGDSFMAMDDEREAREVAERRRLAAKDRDMRQKRHVTLDQLHEQIKAGEFHELKLIIKGDTDGSVEAIANALERLATAEVKVVIISKGVGAVKEADIHLAESSEAIIIAFHVLPTEAVRQMSEDAGVTINYYRIIYEVVDDVKKAMEGLLDPEFVEKVTGEARILQLFKIPKIGIVAGCVVTNGVVDRDAKVRLYRAGIEVGEARVTSLKRVKDDVRSVKAGIECGIGIEGLTKEIQDDDILAFFKQEKVARKLSAATVDG